MHSLPSLVIGAIDVRTPPIPCTAPDNSTTVTSGEVAIGNCKTLLVQHGMLHVRHEMIRQAMSQFMTARLSPGQHAPRQHAYVTHQHSATDVIRVAPFLKTLRHYQCRTREWDTPIVTQIATCMSTWTGHALQEAHVGGLNQPWFHFNIYIYIYIYI